MDRTIVTKHGEKRMRERVGVPKAATKRMAQLAYENGLRRDEVSGSLGRYFDAEFFHDGSANNVRIWSGKVWIFSDNRLVTVVGIPAKYKKTVEKIWKEKR